jgi:hypothetical protein
LSVSLYVSVCLLVCLSVCMYVCLSACLSVCLSICLLVCPSNVDKFMTESVQLWVACLTICQIRYGASSAQ